jgi:hypothetical protein
MRRMINALNPFSKKFAACVLDRGVFFAVLTRAHTGLADLRPQRSRSSNILKSSRKRANDAPSVAAASRMSISRDEERWKPFCVTAPGFRRSPRTLS